jgi:glycosyltransferase involved in cell wall biosynthesis
MLRQIWHRRSAYNPSVLEKLKEKCERETGFGRFANFLLWGLFWGVKAAKRLRATLQRVRFLNFSKEIAAPVLFSQTVESQHEVSVGCARSLILIIGEDSLSQCKRYRIDAKLSMLEKMGFEVVFFSCWSKEAVPHSLLPFCKVVLFYRVPLFTSWKVFAACARQYGIRVVWEIDDLVFNPKVYAQHPYLQSCGSREKQQLLEGSKLFWSFMDFADEFIVSTPELLTEVTLCFDKPVYVIENAIDQGLLDASSKVVQKIVDSDQILIGYGSGTLTHDADLAVAAPAIAEIMAQDARVRCVLLGHLKTPDVLARFGDRVQKVPFVGAERYFGVLSSLDVCIAPLENSRFNEVKSNIKFLEAALLGVPCVASPSGPFKKVIESGVTGFVAASHEEWVQALKSLVDDPALRRTVARAAKKRALELYHPEVIEESQLRPWLTHHGLNLPASSFASRLPRPKRRLAIVNVFFAPQSFGGATIVAEELAKQLSSEGWAITIFAGNTFDDLADYELRIFEWHGMRVYSVRLPRQSTQALEYENTVIQGMFGRYLDTENPNVVHVHCLQHIGAGILLETEQRSIPSVVTLHDAWWICPRQFRYIHEKRKNCPYTVQNPISCGACFGMTANRVERDRFLRQMLNSVAYYLAPSQFQADLYVKNGFPRDRVKLNGNGVKLPARPRLRRQGGTAGQVVFAHLGGPSDQKGYAQLRAAFESVTQSNYTVVMTDSDQRLGLRTNLGRDWRVRGQVQVVPPFAQSEIDEFFDGVDVLLVYSQWDECFGLVLREALARDVWVICSDAGGLPEAVDHGVNGFIVPKSDQAQLVATIQYCLEHPEMFATHVNPKKDAIRSFQQQANELSGMLSNLCEK